MGFQQFTSRTPEEEFSPRSAHGRVPSGEERVFGKVSASRRDGQGARPADIELFEPLKSSEPLESSGPSESLELLESFGETAPLPGIPAPSVPSAPSSPSRPAQAVRRSARRSTRRRKQSPALLIGTVTVGIGAAISVSLVCEAFTARHSDFGTPVSTTLSSRDSATPSSSATPTGTARPAQEPPHTRVTRSTVQTPPPATSSTAPSATPPAAPSTPAGPPAHTPSPPRDETRTAGRPDIALGSTGREVEDLQRRLQQLYLYLGSTDGNFTVAVEVALSRYQKARNIPEEPGVYGPLTRAALRAETESTGRDSRRNGDSGRHGGSPRYGSSDPYRDSAPYGNPNSYGNPAPYGNPNSYGNTAPYGSPDPYENPDPHLDHALFQKR